MAVISQISRPVHVYLKNTSNHSLKYWLNLWVEVRVTGECITIKKKNQYLERFEKSEGNYLFSQLTQTHIYILKLPAEVTYP